MIPIQVIARTLLESIVRVVGIALAVIMGLGQVPALTGRNWLSGRAIRFAGVLIGLVVVIASSRLGDAFEHWLQGGH